MEESAQDINKKKKVLFLIHTLQIGGAERVLVDLVNNLPANKYDITLMTVVDVGILKRQLKPHIKYESIFSFKALKKLSGGTKKYEASTNATSKKNIPKELFIKAYTSFWKHANLKKLYEKHIKEKYDIEVSFLEGIPAKIIANSTNPNSKKMCWIHIDLINEPKSDKFFKNVKEQKKIYNKFDKIICVSEEVKNQLIKKLHIKEDKLKIVYNPIDAENILKKSKEKTIKKDNKKLTFCSVGRLAKQKGYDRLIDVCSQLEKEKYNFEVWIVGTGPELKNLEDKIREKGVTSIKLLGYHPNPYPYIKSADWFLCSSRAEGFSTVVAEAIILEKAIISTNCSGAEEMLGKNSEYGIVCENSEDGIYESMKKILNCKELSKHYETVIKHQQKLFILEKSINDIEKAL
ncbi:glycosyltransferase [Candidatus Saccharibacteria bacterium]|nr:glycosyltransferase [Candidatus Saccharibacteria bacterium]